MKRPSTTIRRLALSVVALLVVAAPAAADLPRDQQRCLNGTGKLALRIVRAQNAWNLACARAGTAATGAGGDCMADDAKGRVARRMQALETREATLCSAARRPSFAHPDAATVVAAGRATPLDLARGLFGTAPENAFASEGDTPRAHRCQVTVLARTNRLFETLWQTTLQTTKNVLRGKARLAPPTGAAVTSADALAAEIQRALDLDTSRRIGRATARITTSTRRSCTSSERPLNDLFPGECASATTTDALAACAATLARRQFQRSLAAIDALIPDCDLLDDGAANLSCASPALQRHALDRLGYGGSAAARAHLDDIGVRNYILEQLAPAAIADDALDTALAQFPSLTMNFSELRAHYPIHGGPGQQRVGDVLKELTRAKILRAVSTRRQLEQVLVDFWLNHFNVNTADRRNYDIVSYERDVIRPHALGRFGELLLAVARSPAMGDYLQNRHNHVGALNENYGRELLEVHTVGLDAKFTEADVNAAARAFTGWREDYLAPEGFQFVLGWHDREAKTVLDLTLPARGGEEDGLQLLAYLAAHPSTARNVSRKLVVRFVADTPPPRLVDAATAVFLATDGDLRAVLETILLSPEFLQHPEHRHNKVKRPLTFVASLARVLGADPAALNLDGLRTRIRDMGEELYRAAPPMGYGEESTFWTSPGGMILRVNEINRATGRRQGYDFTYPRIDGEEPVLVASLIDLIFADEISPATRAAAITLLEDLPPAGPDARVEHAAAILLASPEFLHH